MLIGARSLAKVALLSGSLAWVGCGSDAAPINLGDGGSAGSADSSKTGGGAGSATGGAGGTKMGSSGGAGVGGGTTDAGDGSAGSSAGGVGGAGGAGGNQDASVDVNESGTDAPSDRSQGLDSTSGLEAGEASASDTGSDVTASDTGSDVAVTDAGSEAAVCSVGQATSDATADNLSLFGTPVYFNNGNPLPAGTYQVQYVDGCIKYAGDQGWTVNAFDTGGCCNWQVVGETTSDQKTILPGTIGYAAGSGAFANFEDCVTASKAVPVKQFEHAGGKLGIWLKDSNYIDNLAGEAGRNPKWQLVRLGACVDGGGDANPE
jgi:hypothetical protein